ncbi:MAG: hypothetical protein IH946_08705 [Bacteroidetes bacterium]|nr:hypothetical protein [Bacteroidota bacterium]
MKIIYSLFFASLFGIGITHAQVTFWQEDFESGFTSPNGTWTVVNVGTNGGSANEWYISCLEAGQNAFNCSFAGCSGGIVNNPFDSTLHVSYSAGFGGDAGAK